MHLCKNYAKLFLRHFWHKMAALADYATVIPL